MVRHPNHRADHFAHAAADTGAPDDRRLARCAVGAKTVSMAMAPWTGHFPGRRGRIRRRRRVFSHRDPASSGPPPCSASSPANGALGLAFKSLPWVARGFQADRRRRRCSLRGSASVQPTSFLASRMGRQPRAAPGRTGRKSRLVVGQGTGGTSQDALDGIAGEVAGLVPGRDVGDADPHAVIQVGQRIACTGQTWTHWPHLMQLAEEVLLVQGAGGRRRRVRHRPAAGAPTAPRP